MRSNIQRLPLLLVFVTNSRRTNPLKDNLQVWRDELGKCNFENSEYLLDGIENGFRIIDSHVSQEYVRCKNYKSAINSDIRDDVEAQIVSEIENGPALGSSTSP